MNTITDKDIRQYIENDKTYLITFVYKGGIFKKNIEHIHTVTNDMEKFIINKLKNYKTMRETNIFERDIYFSQIRDKNDKFEKVYSNEYKYITEFKYSYTTYLIELNYKEYNKTTFPNLNKYHYSSKIEQKKIKIENIILIIENNNIFIEFKNPNINTLCDIINSVNAFNSFNSFGN
jgi:hypothetical protein